AMTDTSSCGGVAADQRYEACLVLTPGLIDATGVNASVKVDDVAGNSISTSDTTNAVVDTKVPVFTSSGLTIAVDNGVSGVAAVNGGTTVADQVKVNAALSVADGDTITWNASPIGGLAAVTNGVTVTVLAGSTDNAAQSFSVVATDNAGNMTAMSSQAIDGKTIAIDNTIPVLTSSGLTIAVDNGVSGVAAVNGGSTPADQVRVNATVAVIDGDTITWDATPIAGGGTITNGTTVTLLPGSTENSAQTFSIRVMDNAGNVVVMSSQAIDGKTISVDNVIPASPSSLVLNGGNTIIASQVSSVILQGFTAQPGLLMYAIIDSQSGSQNWAENVSGGAFSTTPRNLSAFAEGILQVFATIQDNAGNISSSGQTTGVKDTQGSAVTGVQLNGGQVINAAVQGSVNLVFTAGETGTAYWAIHDGVNSVTGSRVVSSVGLQTVSSLDLSGLADGTLSIEISFTDLAGNVSSLATSTAQKDTIAATLTNFSFNGGNVVNASVQSSVTMSFQASEMGTLTYIISDVGNVHSVSSAAPIPVGVVSPQVFSTTVNVTSLNDGSLSISLSFTDNVGNVRVASESAQKNSIGPLVTDGSISISGGTGTGGAYIVGNTLVVKWDNSVSGNNNPDVASVFANLSGWGGGSSVAMTDTSSCGGVAADQRYEACLV
ncbi:MAG: hypothetical protein Q8O95_05810, partial [bacterium]|nr:hypothetical protein [bacterium]